MNEVLKLERLHAVGDPTGGRWPSRDLSLAWALLPPHPLGSEGPVSHGIHYDQVREPGGCVGQLHPSPSYYTGEAAGAAGMAGPGPWSITCWVSWPVSPGWQSPVCSLEQDTRLLHAQVGFQGRGRCSLSFHTHVFFYSCPWLVTILVSSSLFSWQGRLLWFQNQTTVGISTCGQFPGLCQQMGENGNPSQQGAVNSLTTASFFFFFFC